MIILFCVVIVISLIVVGCSKKSSPTVPDQATNTSVNTNTPTNTATGCFVVTFADGNLETAIRDTIGKPLGDITNCDLQAVISLDASDRGIGNLSGIEYCVNLRELY